MSLHSAYDSTLRRLRCETDDYVSNGLTTIAKLATGCIGMSLFLWGAKRPTTLLTLTSLPIAYISVAPAFGPLGDDPRNFPLYKMGLVSLLAGMQIAIVLKTWDSMGWVWNSPYGALKTGLLLPVTALTLSDLVVLKGIQGAHTFFDYFGQFEDPTQ